ncbi:transcription factor HHO6-like isoform X2 [Cucurbita moschata]|uniref:Transcription factor HHO6-like isoform X2 n=1 Tax=Cucurbita moschata TaxID=3662 RepID=A0A6J1GLM6_CUCMO|nr:transcription factor HHO6-like isoform X2 [Cucurbita moschata]
MGSVSDFQPKTITDFLRQISMLTNAADRTSKLDDLVKNLQDEMKKIDAFKRELPFCMLLLNDAILALGKPKLVLEEFVSLNRDSSDEEEKEQDCGDKKEWMSSVQLWKTDQLPNAQIKTKSCSAVKKEEKIESPICALSLVTPCLKNPREGLVSCVLGSSGNRATSTSFVDVRSNLRTVLPQQQSPGRKQRRCWSPELHRRFENALQQLGGSQVATPKQIRELMQVDGLTNDEVKSHLQKYRLHTRRVPSTPAARAAGQSPVVLGDLRMSQDGCGESSKVSSSQSASPQGPLQFNVNGGYSTTRGDGMEDEEDTKSESYGY